jgi:16S rRNA (uracil1498-N3)-methyltransferase
MHHFYEPDIIHGTNFLNEEESKHALKVMRLREGDLIDVMDGKGSIYHCRITNPGKNCEFKVLDQKVGSRRPFLIHIAIAPAKNPERMEWFIEKATEIGIDKVSVIITRNTERNKMRKERMLKKAVSAMKQSMNLWLPEINEEIDFLEFIKNHSGEYHKFIAYVDENHQSHLKDAAPRGQSTLILIGPEGDFTKEEIKIALEHDFSPVSLGQSRLRTETAGIVACHTLNMINWGVKELRSLQ